MYEIHLLVGWLQGLKGRFLTFRIFGNERNTLVFSSTSFNTQIEVLLSFLILFFVNNDQRLNVRVGRGIELKSMETPEICGCTFDVIIVPGYQQNVAHNRMSPFEGRLSRTSKSEFY